MPNSLQLLCAARLEKLIAFTQDVHTRVYQLYLHAEGQAGTQQIGYRFQSLLNDLKKELSSGLPIEHGAYC